MKMKLATAIFLLLCGCGASAQWVRPADLSQDDVTAAIELLGVEMRRFDISDLASVDGCKLAVYVDQYDSSGKKRVFSAPLGAMRVAMSKMSPEERRLAREMFGLDANTEYLERYNAITPVLKVQDDTTLVVKIALSGGHTPSTGQSFRLKLRPLLPGMAPMYALRPFTTTAFGGVNATVPLLYYSSFWFDEKANVWRSCGVREVDPAMTDEVVRLSPHAYVIGLEITGLRETNR